VCVSSVHVTLWVSPCVRPPSMHLGVCIPCKCPSMHMGPLVRMCCPMRICLPVYIYPCMCPHMCVCPYVFPCTCFPPVHVCGCLYVVCIKRLVVHRLGSVTPLSQSGWTGRKLVGSDSWLHWLHSVDRSGCTTQNLKHSLYYQFVSGYIFALNYLNLDTQKILLK
jgi:hypothetical protein